MARPLFWFDTERYHGSPVWRVYLAHEGNVSDLWDAHGITYFQSREVFVNVRFPRASQDETVLHELGHTLFGPCDDTTSRAEEKVVTRLELLLPTLKRCGLQWPRRPRGYTALRREALAIARRKEEA